MLNYTIYYRAYNVVTIDLSCIFVRNDVLYNGRNDRSSVSIYNTVLLYGRKMKMPQGKGSYGHQRGRPPKKAKKTPKTSKKGKKGSKKGKKW